MQIVVMAFLDESMALMQDASRIVDLYEAKSLEFFPELLVWIKKAEGLMKTYRRSQLGAMSALRGRILAAHAGIQEGAAPELRRLQARKQSAGACLLLLSQAQALLQDVHACLEAKRDEAARMVQQMLQILLQNGVLPALLQGAPPSPERLGRVWQTCQARAEVASGARQVLGLVAWADALRLIDETLDLWSL